MDDGKPDDWLPEGWSVQVRVRKSGRKDKLYFPPTGEAKFYSKLEVTRYLQCNSDNNTGNIGNSSFSTGNNSSNNDNSGSDNNIDLNKVNGTRISKMVNTTDTSTKIISLTDTGNNLSADVNTHGSDNDVAVTPTSKNQNNIKESNQIWKRQPTGEEKQQNGTPKQSSKGVTFEKVTAEGLPPGWTKEVKITKKKARKIRRDPFYTDPEGNYTFRSLKDALRYLETGEVGKLAKRRTEARHDGAAEDAETPSPASAKKQKLEIDDKIKRTEHSSKVSEMAPVSKILPDMPAVQHRETNKSLKVSEVAPPSEVPSDKESDLEVIEVTPEANKEHSSAKSKNKKDRQLPCRSSRRLAAVQLEAVKSSSKTVVAVSLDSTASVLVSTPSRQLSRTMSVKESDASEESSLLRQQAKTFSESNKRKQPLHSSSAPNENAGSVVTVESSLLHQQATSFHESKKSKQPLHSSSAHNENPGSVVIVESSFLHQQAKTFPESNKSKQPLHSSFAPHGNAGSVVTVESSLLHQQAKTISESNKSKQPLHSSSVPNESAGSVVTVEESGKKAEGSKPLDLPLGELWEDPCIAFAIKTLTGSLDELDNKKFPLTPNNNGDFASCQEKKSPATPANRKIEPIEHPGSPVSLSAAYSWADPCIEFAIKTLTGAIPLDSDLFNKQDSLQQKQHPVSSNSALVFPSAVTSTPLTPPVIIDSSMKNDQPPTKRRVTRSQRKGM